MLVPGLFMAWVLGGTRAAVRRSKRQNLTLDGLPLNYEDAEYMLVYPPMPPC
ncbi:hypothetical protein WG66_012998 [Moniliophthora roreri]|uniref:Uncharacterized protein n=1 Tax=Moniliophthora roreri TaxID=221103 RepID=A0A0W0G199_MONRR|nr:hypothetical protein WG66_012998 [Moniliophthora roreri]